MFQNFSFVNFFHTVRKLIGIGLTIVGAIMFLNPFAKYYIFGFQTSSYFNPQQECYYAMNQIEPQRYSTMKACVEDKITYERQNYRREKQEQMVDGFITLLVGLVILFLPMRKPQQA
ncbi:hypothetical protein H6771_03010 [Candidatus Peribacteria bacterium]|nr:hypothetical protein [Candidatus Peribacteria bacterium]